LNFWPNGKLVTAKALVIGVKCPTGLESLNRYSDENSARNRRLKIQRRGDVRRTGIQSPGTLKLVTPANHKLVPSCNVNCCTSQSPPSMMPLVLRSRNFLNDHRLCVRHPADCSVMTPL